MNPLIPTELTAFVRIEHAWPPPQLSPNGRYHHMEQHRFKKAAKTTAYWLTKSVLGLSKFEHDGEIPVQIDAHAIEGKPAPDKDNLIASCKAILDGIALALGVDDKRFSAPAVDFAEPVKSGKIVIAIGSAA